MTEQIHGFPSDKIGLADCFKEINCVQCCKGLAWITAVALTALGGLAIIGLYYPESVLGILGSTFGHIGAYSTLAAGISMITLIVMIQCCSTKKKKNSELDSQLEKLFYLAEEQKGN